MPNLPVLTAAYDGRFVTSTWLPWVSAAATNYQLSVVPSTGTTAVTASVSGPYAASGRILVPALGGGATLTVTAYSGTTVLAQSPAIPLPTALPAPISIRYESTSVTVSATWSPGGSAQAYRVMLLDGDVVVASTSIPNPVATGGSVTIAGPLAQDAEYSFLISADTTTNGVLVSAVAAQRLLTTVPQLTSANYDGTTVRATWAPFATNSPAVRAWTLRVWNRGGGTIQSVTVTGATLTSAALQLQGPLPAANDVLCEVAASTGTVVLSASPAVQLLNTTPALQTAIYDGTRIAATWTPVAAPRVPVTGYTLRVASASTGVTYQAAIANPVATGGVLPLPQSLAPSDQFTFSVVANTAGGGASSASVPVVDTLPVVLSSATQPGAVAVTWLPVMNAPVTLTGYTINIFAADGQRAAASTVTGAAASSGTVTFTPPLQGSAPYSVRVSTASSSAGVMASSPSSMLLTAAVAMQNVAYDDEAVVATWRVTGALLPLTSFTLGVTPASGTPLVMTIADPVATSGAVVAPALAAGATVTVIANAGTASARSAPTAVLTALPSLLTCTYDGTAVAATWDISGAAGVTTYTLRVYSAVTGVVASATIDNPAAVSGSLTLPAPLPNGVPFFVQICANAPGGQACSVPASLMTEVPIVTAVDVTATGVSVAWQPLSGGFASLTGFAILVIDSGGVVRFRSDISNPAATSGTVTATFIDAAYSVRVSAVSGDRASSLGPVVAIWTGAMSAPALAYDGAVLMATAAPSTAAGVTGYLCEIYAGTTTVAQQRIEGQLSSGNVVAITPFAAAPGVAYTAALRPIAGIVIGRGTVTALLTNVPGVTTIATSAADVVVRLDSGAAARGYLFENERAVAGPETAASSAITFAYTAVPQAVYTTRVQLTSASATGPLSAPLPVVSAVPQFTSLIVEGATLQVAWTRVAGPAISGYVVTLTESGGTPQVTYTNGTSANFTVQPNMAYSIEVAAMANTATGVVATASVITESVAVATAAYDGELLTVTWPAAATNGATYLVQVTLGGAVISSTPATGTTASVPIRFSAAQSYAVRVVVVSGIATGPAGAPLALLTAYPIVSTISASSTGVSVTVDTATGVQGYLYQGDARVAGPTVASNSVIALTHALQAQSTYSVRVQKTAGTVTGPLTAVAPVISAAPVILDSGYDGTSVRASWTPVHQKDVSGYLVTVKDTTTGTTTKTFATNETSLVGAVTLALSDHYAITVQATGDAATGPASVEADPLANSVGYFFPASSASPYAYLFRGDIRGPGRNTISLYLPQLFGNPPASVSNDPFVLTKLDLPPIPSLPYRLTFTASPIDVWSIPANGIRTNLQQSYIAFLQKVEAPANSLLPGAMNILRQVIAQALPLTFAETLYYTYGFYASKAYVNLQAGMRLRVDFENHQFVSPDPSGLLTGFVGAGTSYLPIGTIPGSSEPSVFDAFLSSMPIPVVAANSGGGAGVIDLTGTRFQMPYLRLFYPPSFPSADGGGATGVAQNAVIVGAPTITVLEQATARYLANRDFSGVSGIVTAYFRGRATLIPEVACFVGGVPVFVSVGTSVRQLTEAYAPLPYGDAATLRGFAYRRAIGNVVTAATQVSPDYAYGRNNDIHFSFSTLNDYSYSGGLDLFDLPVLGGDRIDFEE